MKKKRIWAGFLSCSHTYYSHCHKGVFHIILFNQLNLFICTNIYSVLMQPQVLKTSVIFTAYLSMTELWLSQTLVHWGYKIQRWQERDIKGDKIPDTIQNQTNKSRICSHESQEKFNSALIPICLKCLQMYIYRKWCVDENTVITAINTQETVYWNAVPIFVHFYF